MAGSASIPAHIANLPIDKPVSSLATQAGVLITLQILLVCILRRYVFEEGILPWCHGAKYTSLDLRRRKSVTNSYVHVTTRMIVISIAIYPIYQMLFGSSTFQTNCIGSSVTYVDICLVSAGLIAALYVHEILYRIEFISWIALVHHLGSVGVGTYAIGLTANWQNEPNHAMYFVMAVVWGT